MLRGTSISNIQTSILRGKDNQRMPPPIASLLVSQIDAALPQTQCTRCGYPNCRAYAEAIATGQAAINQCPPGGAEGVARLAAITGLPVLTLNPVNGVEAARSIAVIDEAWCIGCTLCLPACPADAILGSNKRMHTVIAQHCTGCELCISVCPVDCISSENVTGKRTGWAAWSKLQADNALERYVFHNVPRSCQSVESPQVPSSATQSAGEVAAAALKLSVISSALAKSRAARSAKT